MKERRGPEEVVVKDGEMIRIKKRGAKSLEEEEKDGGMICGLRDG